MSTHPDTAQQARDIAVEAYIYLYPLVTMDLTRRQLTNLEPGKAFGKGPMNMFVNVPAYPPSDFKGVVRSNFDTLYSSAWLDLTREPVVMSAPDTAGRYYLLPMLDMWTDVFASPGARTTGTEANDFLVTPPGWQGAVPHGLRQLEAPTPYVWVIGRTKTDGAADYPAVHAIQAGYKVTALSAWGTPSHAPVVSIDPTTDMDTPPKEQVEGMSSEVFFSYASELLKIHPPHITDQPIVDRMARIGIRPGTSFRLDLLEPSIREAVQHAAADGKQAMAKKLPTLARLTNGWQMNTDTMGVYGNFYLKRAIIAQIALGMNVPEDAFYPINLADSDGQPLDGNHNYVLHFPKGETPPVDAFWSLTLYDSDGFQVANALDRFALSSYMPLLFNADGSLDLYMQNQSPGAQLQANWLPAPVAPFNVNLRIYAPKAAAISGEWNPPEIRKLR